jgi:diadenylate cyclase
MIGFVLLHAVEWAKVAVEIGLLAVLIYLALQFVRETRAVAILAGIIILALSLRVLSDAFGLEVIGYLVRGTWAVLALTTVIVFQPEVRRALSEIGRQGGFLRAHGNEARAVELVNTLVDATYFLADRRIGALIASEQSIGLRSYAETGTPVEATVSAKLLSSVFFPNTPLHDGGVIIRRDQLVAAGCIFPLSQSPELGMTLGTRHRAGVGLCEETDAVVIVVSEESGAVSLARSGRLTRGVARERFKRHLTNYLVKKAPARRAGGMFRLGASRAASEAPAAGEG